jgi:hypothetical protein
MEAYEIGIGSYFTKAEASVAGTAATAIGSRVSLFL